MLGGAFFNVIASLMVSPQRPDRKAPYRPNQEFDRNVARSGLNRFPPMHTTTLREDRAFLVFPGLLFTATLLMGPKD